MKKWFKRQLTGVVALIIAAAIFSAIWVCLWLNDMKEIKDDNKSY